MSEFAKLDPEFKAQWVEALESGRYAQGRSMLRTNNDKFCCLGVAADLKDPEGWCVDGGYEKWNTWAEGHTDLGNKALEEINLSLDAQDKLIGMNDDGNMSFASIAKWIKENL